MLAGPPASAGLRSRGGLRSPVVGACVAILLAACSETAGPVGPPPPPPPPPPPDFAALFAPATASEVAEVRTEWAARSPAAVNVIIELTAATTFGGMPGDVTVLSHVVDGNRHFGAVFVPDAAPVSAPIVVFVHAGEGGVSIPAPDTDFLVGGFGGVADRAIYVIPSYRSEELRVAGQTFLSGGNPSPWDRDVDDALSLLEAAIQTIPQADPSRIAALGISRGGLVALLLGARDSRIDAVIELVGPTDFFEGFVRNLIQQAASGGDAGSVGIAYLNDMFIQPWMRGELPLSDIRRELVRRSAVLVAEDLPNVQLHHGTNDVVVPVSQARSLIDAMGALGRTPPAFEGFLYTGGGHQITTLAAGPARAGALLADMWPPGP